MRRTVRLQPKCAHTCSWQAGPGAFQAPAGHRVANVDVEDNKEDPQNDHLFLHATVRAQAAHPPG